MAQEHLDSLSGVDASFLHQEGAGTHMHIGGIALLDGPPPPYPALRDHIRSRLHMVPRYRQKLAAPPLGLGRWRWIDDPTFNLDYHVRHTALPQPGDDAKLHALAARIFSQRLDRTKPLWELWLVEGLPRRPLGAHLEDPPRARRRDQRRRPDDDALRPRRGVAAGRPAPDRWEPRPEPSTAQLTATSLNGAVRRLAELPLRAAATAAKAPARRSTGRARRSRRSARSPGQA
jgi:hypothetical protein